MNQTMRQKIVKKNFGKAQNKVPKANLRTFKS